MLGIEPARNIAALAEADGVPTRAVFFCEAIARSLRAQVGRAAGIVARHVFAHVDDLGDFLRGVDRLLAPEGVFAVEVPYLSDLIANLEFDTIYHEHLSYFALVPLMRICEAHSFRVVDVERINLHGGSIMLHIRHAGRTVGRSSRLEAMWREEVERGLSEPLMLKRFAWDVAAWRGRFERFVASLVAAGGILIGYGAAAKANTF